MYDWSPGSFLTCDDCSNPIASPEDTTQYCVTVTDKNGCINTKCIDIAVTCNDVFIPSLFSPNGDQINDYFVIEGSCITKFNLRIFNRWGENVFQSQDQKHSWDGTFKGDPLNSGVFAYVFEYTDNTNTSHKVSGNITLIK